MNEINYCQFQCSNCHHSLEKPFNCLQCDELFCMKCVYEINNKEKNNGKEGCCPICKACPFIFKFNAALNDILNKIEIKCKICGEYIKKKNYQSHLKECKSYKCIFCNKEYKGKNGFLAHFLYDDCHKDYLIQRMNLREKESKYELLNFFRFKFNLNGLSRNQKLIQLINYQQQKEHPQYYNSLSSYKSSANIFEQKINDLESSCLKQIVEEKKNENYIQFENLIIRKIKSNQTLSSSKTTTNIFNFAEKLNMDIIKNLPPNYHYDYKSKLIYCGRNNNLNCECCKDGICKIGNCFCLECMKLNKKFHSITQPHYLINKEGRVARYSCKTYQCYYETTKVFKNNNNWFKKKIICNEKNPCKACKELTLLINKYLPKELIEKLKMSR